MQGKKLIRMGCYVSCFGKPVKCKSTLDRLIKKKQRERSKALEDMKVYYVIDAEDKEILSMEVDDLIFKLQSKDLKPTKVVHAFTAQALIVNHTLYCVTDFLPDTGPMWVSILDEQGGPTSNNDEKEEMDDLEVPADPKSPRQQVPEPPPPMWVSILDEQGGPTSNYDEKEEMDDLEVLADPKSLRQQVPEPPPVSPNRFLLDSEEPKSLLYGLPFAISDEFDVEGLDTTLGYAKNLFSPAETSAVLVHVLIRLGAVPFVKTNVGQSLFTFGSDNPIFKTTLHPTDPDMSPGGSCCGAGVIVASDAAVFAIGSDIIGNLRIPAHFTGVSSFKPTLGRLSGKGMVQSCPKLLGFVGAPGVIAKSAKTLYIVISEILKDKTQNELDPRVIPIPWNEQVFSSQRKLKVGYFTSLSFYPAIGDTPEMVWGATVALEHFGCGVVPFEMPDDFMIVQLLSAIINADGGSNFRELFRNEEIARAIKPLESEIFCFEWFQRLSILLSVGTYCCSKRQNWLSLAALKARKSKDLWNKMHEREELIDEILLRMDHERIDMLLCPVFPFPSVKLKDPGYLFYAGLYTMIWNLLDFPTGTVPFGFETLQNNNLLYNHEGDNFLRFAVKTVRHSKGMPISVQLIAKPYQEELLLRTMIGLERARDNN